MSDENKTDTPAETSIPYERFEKKVNENRALKTALEEQQKELDGLRGSAASLEEMSGALERLRAETDAERRTLKTTLELSRAGVNDDETAELVRWRFEKSGKSPEDFTEWLSGDARADRLLERVFAPAVEVPTTPQAAPVPVNGGTRAAPPPRAVHTLESVQNMSTDQLRENYADIMKTWGFQGHDFSKPSKV